MFNVNVNASLKFLWALEGLLDGTQALRHSEGTWALRGHLGTQRALGHSEGTWALGHSEGSRRLLGHLGHSGTRALRTPGHLGTWALRALRHLGTQALRVLGHLGTYALGHSKHLSTRVLGHSRHFIQHIQIIGGFINNLTVYSFVAYCLKISTGIFIVLYEVVSTLVGRLCLKARISYKSFLLQRRNTQDS